MGGGGLLSAHGLGGTYVAQPGALAASNAEVRVYGVAGTLVGNGLFGAFQGTVMAAKALAAVDLINHMKDPFSLG
jgi:hypothetical protein